MLCNQNQIRTIKILGNHHPHLTFSIKLKEKNIFFHPLQKKSISFIRSQELQDAVEMNNTKMRRYQQQSLLSPKANYYYDPCTMSSWWFTTCGPSWWHCARWHTALRLPSQGSLRGLGNPQHPRECGAYAALIK